MLKKGPHPIDKAIWGALDGAGAPESPKPIPKRLAASPEPNSGLNDLRALLAASEAGAAAQGRTEETPVPVINHIPVFPFGQPGAAPPAPAPLPSDDDRPSFHDRPASDLILPGALLLLTGLLVGMAVHTDPSDRSVTCAPAAAPAAAAPAFAAEEQHMADKEAPQGASTEVKPPEQEARPAHPAVRDVRARRAPRAAPPPAQTGAPDPVATPKPPAAAADPCKGDLLCAMKRATGQR